MFRSAMDSHFLRIGLSPLLAASLTQIAAAEIHHPLQSLDLASWHQDYGRPHPGTSITGRPISLGGKEFPSGVGSHANGSAWYALGGTAVSFHATVGVDDHAGGPGSVVFILSSEHRELWNSGVMHPGDPPKSIDLPLAGVDRIHLESRDAGDGISFDHADWADAAFVMHSGHPQPCAAPGDEPVILTPPPGPQPALHGPSRYGARPGHPFLYRIPCQGTRPIRFSADALPPTLHLDPATGILTGITPPAGDYPVVLHASNPSGSDSRSLHIAAGGTLALTPPMGWNDWYVHYDRITDTLVREAADAMVSSGMADVGYMYINIDDCWMNTAGHKDPLRNGPARDAAGRILPNRHFPDMQALTGHIHSLGLKAGIYTSPGPFTCAGFTGSHHHEADDAATFANWGFDFLKYDWCSYGGVAKQESARNPSASQLAIQQQPYRMMGSLLRQQPRDIVFNFCQYGIGNVWEWGAGAGGQCWRTAGDLGFELNRIDKVAIRNAALRAWSAPGAWNDPDYIQIGWIGDAADMGQPHPCPLTPNEQYSYMSLWALMASPLIFSGDMQKLDDFTRNVLCNPEVIDIDQDELGQSAQYVPLTATTYLMIKDLAGGARAVGCFNTGDTPADITIPPNLLGPFRGPATVRDVWRRINLPAADGPVTTRAPRHGVSLLRLEPPASPPP